METKVGKETECDVDRGKTDGFTLRTPLLFPLFQLLGDAGSRVVVEDFMRGEEASLFAIVDGLSVLPLVGAQDHKAVGEGDTGPNTGGMGAYSPAPVLTE